MKSLNVPAVFLSVAIACLAASCCCEPCVPAEKADAPSSDPETENHALVGAYSEWISPVSEDALSVFSAATKNTEFAGLVPVRFSTQVVAGTNYRFDCGEKIIVIFEPLPCNGGEPRVVNTK